MNYLNLFKVITFIITKQFRVIFQFNYVQKNDYTILNVYFDADFESEIRFFLWTHLVF